MPSELLRGRIKQFEEYRRFAKLAREQTGKSVARQAIEIHGLRNHGGACGVSDYYWFKLYDDAYLYGEGRRDFLGWRLQTDFSLALNPRNAVLPAWDKCVFAQLATAAGLPIVPVHACFHPSKSVSGVLGEHLHTPRAVGEYLRNPSLYPLFGKPAYSQQGYGSVYFAGYDSARDRLNLLNGDSIAIDDFTQRLTKSVDERYHRPECGFVFQRALVLAPEIQEISGWTAICGVRIICLNGPNGVKPIRAIWKIAVPPNHVDNFSLGKYGNLLADIDLDGGEVSRCIRGLWPYTEVHATHPASGRSMLGFKVPGWGRLLEICEEAGKVFPLMKIHHWDFAITDQGPLILELNDIGSTEIAQVHGRGLLSKETREFLKRFGNRNLFPWISAI